MSGNIDKIKEKLGLKNKDAVKSAAFAKKLFAAIEGFDFAAALEAGNENALAEHIDAIAQERDQAKTELAEKDTLLTEIAEALDADFSAKDDTPAPAPKEVVKAKVDAQALKTIAKAGVEPEKAPKEMPEAKAGNVYEEWKAMEPGKKRTDFYRANKEEIFEISRQLEGNS